jgi:hypothetical protein
VKNANVLLKLAAVASSVVLVGGFVSYRAGALNWLMASEVPPAQVDENSPADQPPSAESPLATPAIMSGSKSGIYIVPAAPAAKDGPTAPSPAAPPTIMPGSKSVAPLIPPKSPPPASGPQSFAPSR